MGIWILEIHHPLDYQERIHPSYHDEHELDSFLLPDRNHFLVLWKDFQKVDEEFEGTQHVTMHRRGEIERYTETE